MAQKPLSTFTLEPILRWPSEEAKAWLYELLSKLEPDPAICSVLAIGSAVREGVESADLDLVILHSGAEVRRLDVPPIDVDLRSYRIDDVETLVRQGNDLLGWAVKYGKPLLDKDNAWCRLAESLRPVLPLPPEDISLERALKAEAMLRTLLATGDDDAAHDQLLSLLTYLARARLVRHGIYPASRPELPKQLRQVDEAALARLLEQSLKGERPPHCIYRDLKNLELKVAL